MKTSEILMLVIVSGLLNIFIVQVKAENLAEIWNKINTNTSADLETTLIFAKKLKDEQQTIAELQATVRRYLRTKNSELLANVLSTNGYSETSSKLKDIMKNISENYDAQLIEDILYDAINEIYNTQGPSVLVDALWDIYTAGDLASLDLMLRAQLKLMRLYNEKSYDDEKEFLRKYAFMLYNIKYDSLYGSIKGYLKSALDLVVTKLPNNLQYLFFNPYFCLMNSKYSEYVYTAVEAKIDEASRYIWLWYEKLKIDETGHIKADIFESTAGNNTHFKVTLKGTQYQLYYYKMTSTNVIAGWQSTDVPIHNIWDIDFVDNDRVAFSQDGYFMCSTQEKYNSERRNVTAYKAESYSKSNEECQWYLGRCDRKNI